MAWGAGSEASGLPFWAVGELNRRGGQNRPQSYDSPRGGLGFRVWGSWNRVLGSCVYKNYNKEPSGVRFLMI